MQAHRPLLVFAPRMTDYRVYENWTVKRARIHRSECPHCNYGRDTHSTANEHNGKWHGPFATAAIATQAAQLTGQLVSRCAICKP